MEKLLKLYGAYQREKQSLELNITHDKYGGWIIQIFHNDSQTCVVDIAHESLELAYSQAFIELESWGRNFQELEDIVYNIF